MTLRHGPANGPLRHAPMDTVETLMAYQAWRLQRLRDRIADEVLSGEWLERMFAPLLTRCTTAGRARGRPHDG